MRISELGGGITNHNYKVEVAGDVFVLRMGGAKTDQLGIDRAVEHAAGVRAYEVGLGPEVVEFVRSEGWLVARFIDGKPIPVEAMREPEMLARVAGALRRFHDSAPIPGHFDAHAVVEDYRDRAGEIRIVDWEYAGMGDRFFDLANLSVNHEFGVEDDRRLLAAYFGAARGRDLASLRLMRFMSDFREAMWGVLQSGISELEFGFTDYAEKHFARLGAMAADSSFEGFFPDQDLTREPVGS